MVFYLGIFFLKKYVFKTVYESNAMDGADKIISTFPHYLDIYSNKRFLLNCITRYYWIPILSTIIGFFYLVRNDWKKLFLFILFFIGYLLVVNVSYPEPSTTIYYIENLYLPLSIFIAFPLVYDILPAFEQKKTVLIGLVVLILLSGLVRLYSAHSIFKDRINWQRSILKQYAERKIVMDSNVAPKDTLLMTWGTPYEFWLLSTAESKKSASIIINDHIPGLEYAIGDPKAFITTWGAIPYRDFPKKYFLFNDTVSTYEVIK